MKNLEEAIEYSYGLKLLYVEDNEEARAASLDIFEDFFKDITIAVNGEDGLEKFKNSDIDIIISDIYMPKLNGIEMIKKIREFDKNIPILILSAHNETSFFIDSIKLGVEGYLLKPIDIDQFTDALYKCVKNIALKKENLEYKHSLESKVKEQIENLRQKDNILLQQSKMASMGEMIDAIAHQWKQPINIISLYTDLLYTNTFSNAPTAKEVIVEHCNKTYKQIDHITNTLNEFRNFFRPDCIKEPMSIKSLFDSIVVLLHDELTNNNIKIEILCENDPWITLNENDIKHLIINLINNAKDEMIKSNIENRKITLICEVVEDKTIIKVKDSGNGIPLEIIDKIFNVNFTTKQSEGGTGIGLYMCKLIADKYGAEIEVRNSGGAEFLIKF